MMQYDGDLHAAAGTTWSRRRPSSARWASTWRANRRRAVRHQRDAEVRPRDLLLERQPQRHVRPDARDVRRDPERPRAVRGAAVDEGGRDHRRADRGAADRPATASRASTTPTATWSATPATATPRSSRSRPSTCASGACCR